MNQLVRQLVGTMPSFAYHRYSYKPSGLRGTTVLDPSGCAQCETYGYTMRLLFLASAV